MLGKKICSLFICSSLYLFSSTAPAHIVIAPSCLHKELKSDYEVLAKIPHFYLLRVNENGLNQLIEAKKEQTIPCGGFMDVSAEAEQFGILTPERAKTFLSKETINIHPGPRSYKLQYPTQVEELLKQLNPEKMWSNLTTLTNFQNRYAKSDLGKKAAEWFKTQVENIAKENNRNDVTVSMIQTGGYKQPSVVAKIGNSSEPGIVISAHMDTIVMFSDRQPGADDDGSGSVTVLEAARTLLASGMTFKKPIYVIWYAAEEEGLVGSKYVVTEFKNKKIPVDSVLHYDMTGYTYKNDPSMWLMTDYVNKDLNRYLETLIKTYVKQPVKYTRCGYACSDHATWYKYGYRAAIAAEAAFEHTNSNMHSENDTMDKLSLNHMTDYAKLAVAFTVELAEPSSAKTNATH